MAINLTWGNIFVLVGLLVAVLTGFVTGTGAMVEWRMAAIYRQLDDRLVMYQREMRMMEDRVSSLEKKAN